MSATEPTFEIECGPYRSKIDAPTPNEAISRFWQGKIRGRCSEVLRFREVPWNSVYRWDQGKQRRRGGWYYIQSDAPIPDGDTVSNKITAPRLTRIEQEFVARHSGCFGVRHGKRLITTEAFSTAAAAAKWAEWNYKGRAKWTVVPLVDSSSTIETEKKP